MKGASSAVLALQIIASLSANVNAMRLESLERRAPQTNAVCSSEFAWADTSKNESPCQVAANTMALCNGGSWTIWAINSKQTYDPPNSTTANICSCSWTVYNLLSACSDCQGVPQAVKGWPFYSSQCAGQFLGNDTFFPPSLLTADPNVLIPAWAATDPTQWSGSQYNTVQAKAIAQQGNPDFGAVAVTRKKSSVGPIVGGVIGGLVAVGIAAGIAYYLLRRHRQQTQKPLVEPTSEKGHMRGPSDTTMTSLGYTSYTASSPGPGYSNGAPTIRTHVTSVGNFSVLAGQAVGNTIYTTAPSPPPASNRVVSPNPEDNVVPFTLQRPQGTPDLDRKSPHGPGMRYDSPNAPPAMGGDALFDTPSRPRVNPPAYSAQDNATPSSSSQALVQARRRQGHTNNNSDADLSYASYSSPFRAGGSSSNPEDTSDIFTTGPNDAGSVVAGTTLTRTGSGAAQTSYTSPSYPRDVKRRPTDDSVNIG